MDFQVNDRVVVTNPSLSTHQSTGLVINVVDNHVHVKLDSNCVQFRSGTISSIVRYRSENLALLDCPVQNRFEYEKDMVTLVIWENTFKTIYGAEIAKFVHCIDEEDAKSEAAEYIKFHTDKFHWVSITRPSMVELVYTEPKIQKVSEEE